MVLKKFIKGTLVMNGENVLNLYNFIGQTIKGKVHRVWGLKWNILKDRDHFEKWGKVRGLIKPLIYLRG